MSASDKAKLRWQHHVDIKKQPLSRAEHLGLRLTALIAPAVIAGLG